MKKRIFSIVLSLCMVLALLPATVFGDNVPLLVGDINLDGEVDSKDINLLQGYIEGKLELDGNQLILADINGDGNVKSDDLQALLSLLVFPIKVTNGTATVAGTEIDKAAADTNVTITAVPPSGNMVFDKWIVNEGNVTLADASSETTTFTMKGFPVSVTATYKPLSADKEYTLTVPFITTVKQGGNVAPGKTTFNLQVVDRQGNKQVINDVEVTASITTNGIGDYKGTMTLTGPSQRFYDMFDNGGIFVQQVNAGEANWTYDDTVWCLLPSAVAMSSTDDAAPGNTISIYPTGFEESDDGGRFYYRDRDKNPVSNMTFTNTYTKSIADSSDAEGTTSEDSNNDNKSKVDAEDSAKTGDDSNLTLWLTLLALSAAGAGGTCVYSIRRRSSRAK